MTLIIRKATKKDYRGICNLEMELEAYSKKFTKLKFNKDKYLKILRKRIKRNFEKPRKYYFFIAEDDSKPIGYVCLILQKHGITKKPYGFITDIYLKKQYRGKRIGEQLVLQVIEKLKAKHITELRLQSNINNKKAIRAWERLGFEKSDIVFSKKLN